MSDAEVKTDAQRQRVYPLFILAVLLMVVGFVFVFSEDASKDVEGRQGGDAGVRENAFARVPQDLDRDVAALELAWSEGPRAWNVDMRQSTVRAGAEGASALETHITLTMRDEPIAGEEGLAFSRSYDNARIEVSENGELVAPATAGQVGELLEIAAHRVRFDPHGRILEHAITSSGGASMRQMVGLISDAAMMLSLQLPAEAVNAGEEWSYRSPFAMDGGVEGTFFFSNRLVGIDASDGRVAVIRQDIRGEGKGTVTSPEGKPLSAKLNGAGRAVFWFDLDAGSMRKVELTFDQVSSLGEGLGIQTSTTLSLTPADTGE